MDTSSDRSAAPAILGRPSELARIGALLDSAHGGAEHVLVLTGEPGVGKSTLVEWAAAEGDARGLRVLRVRGSEGESGLALSGLHQLLRPLLSGLDALPESQRQALRCAFGLSSGPEAPVNTLHLCVGVVTLLTEAAARQPLLLLVDDVQWLDLGSLDILAFVARRLDGEPAVMLLASREEGVPARFDRDFPHLVAGPLDRADAGLLLDALPNSPTGRARSQVLQEAAGNPLALIELSRALAKRSGDPGGGQSLTGSTLNGQTLSGQTLPLTRRLENLFAADLPELPEETRSALLLVAASGSAQLADIVKAARGEDVIGALLPAEKVGLLRMESGQVLLRHPLVRSAVYQAASFAERRAAHLALAEALADEPDRRAWHLAAAAPGEDEEVAEALASSAERSRGRGGHAAAAAALERSAELTADPATRSRRLLGAAQSAMFAGHPQWVGEITARVQGLTDDPALRAEAQLMEGWALGVTLRHQEALTALLSVGESMATVAPPLALSALATGATSVYNSGDPFYRTEMRRIYGLIDEQGNLPGHAWVQATVGAMTERQQAHEAFRQALAVMSQDSLSDLTVLGGTAWILDETEEATRILGRTMDILRRVGTAGTNATIAQALAFAHTESGAWASALTCAEDAYWMAAEAGVENVTLGSLVLQATIGAFRGDHQASCARADDALCGIDLRKSRSLQVRYRYALGMAHVVEGDHESAYEELRSTFSRDYVPVPVHYHASVYYLADLAAAAVRVGRIDDARVVLDATVRGLGPDRSPRVHAVVERATALLSEPDAAEEHFLAAVADPAAAGWAFEHALTQLDFGEWLRRRRRTAEARPRLQHALETFRRLDARPWLERAAAELRVAGASVPAAVDTAPTADLTAQELQIAELAAQGLTNRDIASRLYLSPRTVGYHLHKIFPKLGIKTRAQLRDALSTPTSRRADVD
ncbi:helix-turn-helix transcriptional regulator [Streptacidiphilus fuscans]|uniref:AAA family ATPase n=1 Tax=Streptacidiphilus fuscans TaxID=2789292 RepID=A0A931FDP9_9ACTN|nr:LuxR family transcriptional regulator [Streptacidiphilus fuscans]MBF9066709.1 AAA family ATPase [Streptacidiphilus fuscans]